MSQNSPWPAPRGRANLWSLLLVTASLIPSIASAQFPKVSHWGYPGAYQAGADSIAERGRTITVRWLRDPAAEARSDFGGYRIYRVFNSPDSTRMTLLRRYSKQSGDSLFLWHFPPINATTPESQRIATFVDPDSSGNFVKRCRVVDEFGRCVSIGDSILVLLPPPGPHNGFRTWYSITYEAKNLLENTYEDMFVKDPTCTNPDTAQCQNLNHKLNNLVGPLEATPGPTENLQSVSVVPNPFRGSEAWDAAGGNEVHFINLPSEARIRIYTIAGDLVADLQHNDPVHDYARWNLKNGQGQDIVSGIYVYRVEAGVFTHQSRFIVIR
jgi:hypothetical protein